VFPAEGLSPRVDRPTGLRMMSSVVSNQDMIREWYDMSEHSWIALVLPYGLILLTVQLRDGPAVPD
ncbi:hypothetical protein HAX54_006301, partial [Datura stramonium]|nr:hypothetical protein [Datura stramonium]